VLDESQYKVKLNTLLESGVYEPFNKDPTVRAEKKGHNTALPANLKRKLTPYHSRPPHLYGIPKEHKSGIPLRPIVSSIVSPCHVITGFLHKLLKSPSWKIGILRQEFGPFHTVVKSVNLQSPDILASFDAVSLFTNVPVDEALLVIRNKLYIDYILVERSSLKPEAIMANLEVCRRSTN
jgi:hypothetical protein